MQQKSKMIAVSAAIEARTLLSLPIEGILFGIFSSLLIVELLELKKVSKAFKQTVDDYIKESESNIFYAVSLECKMQIGYRNSYASLESDEASNPIWDYIEYPASRLDDDFIRSGDYIKKRVLSSFYNYTLSGPDRSHWLFKSEADALDFFQFPGTMSNGCLCRIIDTEKWHTTPPRRAVIRVSPIYKVQLVHSSNIEEVKEEKELKPFMTKSGNLLPLSASIKFKFFSNQPLRVIIENDLNEPASRCPCVIL